MDGQDRSPLLEYFGRAINRALALRVQNQHQSIPEAESARPHGRDKVGIGIDHNGLERARQPPHQWLAKNVAGSYRKQPPKKFPRRYPRQDQRIDVTLVIGTEKISAALGKFLRAADLQAKAVQRNHMNDARHQKPEAVVELARMRQRQHVWIGYGLVQDCFPSRIGRASSWASGPAART